jgi:hypothetical protein
MSLINVDQSKVDKRAKDNRIEVLRKLLADSDFKVAVDYDQPNAAIKAQRQEWRDEIRRLLP